MNYKAQQQQDKMWSIVWAVGSMLFTLMVIIVIVVSMNKKVSTAFLNGSPLLCYDTLIVSNDKWNLIDDQLVNSNIGGYISLDECAIK